MRCCTDWNVNSFLTTRHGGMIDWKIRTYAVLDGAQNGAHIDCSLDYLTVIDWEIDRAGWNCDDPTKRSTSMINILTDHLLNTWKRQSCIWSSVRYYKLIDQLVDVTLYMIQFNEQATLLVCWLSQISRQFSSFSSPITVIIHRLIDNLMI